MTLIQLGKEYANEIREDIKLGNIAPQVGTRLTYTDDTNPNYKYANTNWVQISEPVYNQSLNLTLTEWLRKEYNH
jgi:hypothetical protein